MNAYYVLHYDEFMFSHFIFRMFWLIILLFILLLKKVRVVEARWIVQGHTNEMNSNWSCSNLIVLEIFTLVLKKTQYFPQRENRYIRNDNNYVMHCMLTAIRTLGFQKRGSISGGQSKQRTKIWASEVCIRL